jgi:hypothetical protein
MNDIYKQSGWLSKHLINELRTYKLCRPKNCSEIALGGIQLNPVVSKYATLL